MVDDKTLSVERAVSKINSGELSVRQLLAGYLENIERLENRVGAWAYFDREVVLNQAGTIEEIVASGTATELPLLSIPVGVKDIFDTADMPTENGTSAQRGRQPVEDAAAVRILRDAGAVMMGKTVTAELAVYTPGKTTNPHDPSRTPGGSSSGSAAAVAAGMVPLAIGTQTNGSVIRPASYCGVVGFKPTFGSISREGILKQAPTLDQIGVFSTNVRDAALLARVLKAGSKIRGSSVGQALQDNADYDDSESREVSQPKLAFVRSPVWHEASKSAQQTYLNFTKGIGNDVGEITLPPMCDNSVKCHRTIMLYEMAHNYIKFYEDHHEHLSKTLLSMIDEGRQISKEAYVYCKEMAVEIADVVDDVLKPFDAVLTPATPTEAPLGLESTGSPIFCTIWSLTGVPAISLPVLRGKNGMPLGLQLVSPRGMDKKLTEIAEWVERFYLTSMVD